MKKSKASRIIAWSELLNSGEYRLSRKHFGVISQLLQYDIHSELNVDDEIDCCSYLLHMVKNFIGQMSEAVRTQTPDARERELANAFQRYTPLNR